MKVTTDGCLFGAVIAEKIENRKSILRQAQDENVLDIGAGTGLLSLMVAQRNPGLKIDAIEVEEAAATQAGENVERSPWPDKIRVIHGDARGMPLSKKV